MDSAAIRTRLKLNRYKMSNREVLASVDAPIPGNDDGTLTLADMIADKGVAPDAHLIYCDVRRMILDRTG